MSARQESEESQDAKYKKRVSALEEELLLVKNALAQARKDKNKVGIAVLRDLKNRVERKIENEKRFEAILLEKAYTGKTLEYNEDFVPTAIRRKYDWRFTNSKKDVEDRFKRYLGKENGENFARKYSIDSIVYKNMYFLEQEREKEKKKREKEKKKEEKEVLAKEKEKIVAAKKAETAAKKKITKKVAKKKPAKAKKTTKKKTTSKKKKK
ncbi:MAG: hypothetical protein JXA43_00130 [Candidatus Diapherotrites archaeon]|nr:hypothetical protein [Candidatus Diapherotrites archaeon]